MEIEQVTEGPDGRVAIVMTMHASGKGSGATLAARTGHIWTLREGLLWHNEAYREPEQALEGIASSRPMIVGDIQRKRDVAIMKADMPASAPRTVCAR